METMAQFIRWAAEEIGQSMDIHVFADNETVWLVRLMSCESEHMCDSRMPISIACACNETHQAFISERFRGDWKFDHDCLVVPGVEGVGVLLEDILVQIEQQLAASDRDGEMGRQEGIGTAL